MEIAFRIGNEYLELQPDTTLDLEEENPFLQLGEEVKGEYTLPFSVKATDHNMRILGYPNVAAVKKNTQGFEAILYADGVEHSRGRIKIETGEGNHNQPQRGTINLYYLYGLSDFWKTVENKFLTDCDYGPDIKYPWRGVFTYNGDGFMAHVTDVLNTPVGTYDYSFMPIINEAGLQRIDATGPCILNNFGTVPNAVAAPYVLPSQFAIDLSWGGVTLFGWRNEMCPFPYLHWVITKVFASFGFKCTGSILEDTDFKKIVLLHNSYIDWVTPNVASLDGSLQYVVWNMKNHVPRIKIGRWLIALCNRFGFWLDFDYRSRVVTIGQRKRVMSERRKREFTTRSAAAYTFTNNKEGKTYSLRQTGGEEKLKIEAENYKGTTLNRYALPAITDEQENHVYFVIGENCYFIATRSDDDAIAWEKAADNTFDYVVKDSNEDITTSCLIPGTEIDDLRNISRQTLNGRMFVAPLVNIIAGEVDSFYIAYDFGLSNSISGAVQTQYMYRMGSAGCHDLQGDLKVATSLAFEYPEAANVDRGMYANEWAYFLSLLLQREEVTELVGMTLADLLNMQYTDTLVINGVEFFVKNPHFTLPLKEFSSMELVRI